MIISPWLVELIRAGSSTFTYTNRRTMGGLLSLLISFQSSHSQAFESKANELFPPNFQCDGQDISISAFHLIGAGAHGRVYKANDRPSMMKISYANTATIVNAECGTLRLYEAASISSVEKCIGQCSVNGLSIALLSPYFDNNRQISGPVLEQLTTNSLERFAKQSSTFFIQSLSAGLLISDVQALVKDDGDVLFIDVSEAGHLDDPLGPTRAQQMLGEWCTVLPPRIHELTATFVSDQLEKLLPGSLSAAAAQALAELPLTDAASVTLQRLEKAAARASGFGAQTEPMPHVSLPDRRSTAIQAYTA